MNGLALGIQDGFLERDVDVSGHRKLTAIIRQQSDAAARLRVVAWCLVLKLGSCASACLANLFVKLSQGLLQNLSITAIGRGADLFENAAARQSQSFFPSLRSPLFGSEPGFRRSLLTCGGLLFFYRLAFPPARHKLIIRGGQPFED